MSADHTQLVKVNGDGSKAIVPLDRAKIVKNGNQTTILFFDYALDRPELRVYGSDSADRFQLVGTCPFDEMATEPNSIVDARDVGDGVILVELHVNPSDSWFVLYDTRAKHLRPYLATAFACNPGGTQVAYIGWQPHWGGGPASVYLNNHVVGTIIAQDYWGIRWNKQLGDFLLFNKQGEGLRLSMPGWHSREMSDKIMESVSAEN